MFPYSDDYPPFFLQLFVIQSSQFYVAINFPFPVLAICCGHFSLTIWTTVPKTTVNKYSNALIQKNNIWFTCDIIGVFFPSPKPEPCKHGPKTFFESCAFAFDGPHGFLAIFRAEIVAHFRTRKATP